MKAIKLSIITVAVILSAIACDNTTPTTQTSNTASQSSPAASPAASANAKTAPVDEFAATRETYTQMCVLCHGPKGEGGIVEIEKTKLKVPGFKQGQALKRTDDQLAKQIADGGESMPPFKERLKPEQIRDLVRFIHREFQSGTATGAATPAPPKS